MWGEKDSVQGEYAPQCFSPLLFDSRALLTLLLAWELPQVLWCRAPNDLLSLPHPLEGQLVGSLRTRYLQPHPLFSRPLRGEARSGP